jgi:cell division septum initiation protein DivIVA
MSNNNKIVEETFEKFMEVIAEQAGIRSGDVTPLQDQAIEDFKRLLVEIVEQNQKVTKEEFREVFESCSKNEEPFDFSSDGSDFILTHWPNGKKRVIKCEGFNI